MFNACLLFGQESYGLIQVSTCVKKPYLISMFTTGQFFVEETFVWIVAHLKMPTFPTAYESVMWDVTIIKGF